MSGTRMTIALICVLAVVLTGSVAHGEDPEGGGKPVPKAEKPTPCLDGTWVVDWENYRARTVSRQMLRIYRTSQMPGLPEDAPCRKLRVVDAMTEFEDANVYVRQE